MASLLRSMYNDSFSFYGFYVARLLRIYPAILLVVFVTSLLSFLLLVPWDFTTFQKR